MSATTPPASRRCSRSRWATCSTPPRVDGTVNGAEAQGPAYTNDVTYDLALIAPAESDDRPSAEEPPTNETPANETPADETPGGETPDGGADAGASGSGDETGLSADEGAASEGTTGEGADGWVFTVTPEMKWLADPAGVHPVMIDPDIELVTNNHR